MHLTLTRLSHESFWKWWCNRSRPGHLFTSWATWRDFRNGTSFLNSCSKTTSGCRYWSRSFATVSLLGKSLRAQKAIWLTECLLLFVSSKWTVPGQPAVGVDANCVGRSRGRRAAQTRERFGRLGRYVRALNQGLPEEALIERVVTNSKCSTTDLLNDALASRNAGPQPADIFRVENDVTCCCT